MYELAVHLQRTSAQTSCATITHSSCEVLTKVLLDGGGGLTCSIFRFRARRKFHGVGCSTGPPADQRQLADLPQSGRVWQCPGASSACSMKIDPSTSWDAGLSLVDTTGLLCLLVLLCKCPWGWPPSLISGMGHPHGYWGSV